MKFTGWFFTSIIIFFSGCMTTPPIENLPKVQLQVSCCRIGSNKADVINKEHALGSKILNIYTESLIKFESNSIFIISKQYFEAEKLFQRVSPFKYFHEYVYYYFDNYSSNDYFSDDSLTANSPIEGAFIEFNCGTEPFGYDTTKANIEYFWEGKYPGLTPVRDVPLDSFKLGYYSIVKWLYAQETDRYKVKRKKYEHFDYDYMSNPRVALENLVLEDPWQEEFLFTTYELIDTRSEDDYDYPILTVVPYTLAPIHLYEITTSEYAPSRGKYHINVTDMAIRVYKYPPYEER